MRLVQEFGAPAVFGRPLGVGELRRMTRLRDLAALFRGYVNAPNKSQWIEAHPTLYPVVVAAMQALTHDR
jgi:hypothetical protein